MPETPATKNQLRAEQLVESLYNDPEVGPKLYERARALFKDDVAPPPALKLKSVIVEPEVNALREQLKNSDEKLSKALERLDARDKKEEAAETLHQMQQEVEAAVNKYSLTAEGKQKMLDWMRDNKVYNAEAAAAVVVHNSPPAPSSGPSWAPHKTDFYGTANPDEMFKDLHKDPEAFRDKEIEKFLKNPEQYAAEAA